MTKSRNIYLKMKTLAEARSILFEQFLQAKTMPGKTIPVLDTVGRALSGPVTAKLSSPNYHAAAMDGIAVAAENTFGASETKPRQLTVDREAFYVNTGHVMPDGCDAVVMIENVHAVDREGLILEIEAPIFPWQHVRRMGEDIVATELLFPRHHVVTPYCLGALLAGGVFAVTCNSFE